MLELFEPTEQIAEIELASAHSRNTKTVAVHTSV